MLQSILLSFGKSALMVFAATLSSTTFMVKLAKPMLLQMVLHKKPKYHFNYLIFFSFHSRACSFCRESPYLHVFSQPRYIKTAGITEIYPVLTSKEIESVYYPDLCRGVGLDGL